MDIIAIEDMLIELLDDDFYTLVLKLVREEKENEEILDILLNSK